LANSCASRDFSRRTHHGARISFPSFAWERMSLEAPLRLQAALDPSKQKTAPKTAYDFSAFCRIFKKVPNRTIS